MVETCPSERSPVTMCTLSRDTIPRSSSRRRQALPWRLWQQRSPSSWPRRWPLFSSSVPQAEWLSACQGASAVSRRDLTGGDTERHPTCTHLYRHTHLEISDLRRRFILPGRKGHSVLYITNADFLTFNCFVIVYQASWCPWL